VEIAASSAVTAERNDVRTALEEHDQSYHIMAEVDDRVELSFPAPPAPEASMRRTVFVRTAGYYDIHLERRGIPKYATLARFRRSGKAMLEYSSRAYARLQDAIRSDYGASHDIPVFLLDPDGKSLLRFGELHE
jgi:hypothetical protein